MADIAATQDQRKLAQIFAVIEPVIDTVYTGRTNHPDLIPTTCIVDHPGASLGEYIGAVNTIYLRRDISVSLMQGILLHELRHADQYLRGFCPSNNVSMQANARAVAAMEADASAVSLLAAWKLSSLGLPQTWDALAGWPMQSDIAAQFARKMQDTQDTSNAVTTAFAQWYDDKQRWHSYYVASCSDFLDREDESHLLPRYDALPSDFFSSLCLMPDQSSYPCEDANWRDMSR